MYDTDKTGKESARKQEKQLEEFSVKRLLLPLSGTKEEKDISDYFKAGNTREDFLKLFIEFLDNLYSDTLIMLKSCEIDFNNPGKSTGDNFCRGRSTGDTRKPVRHYGWRGNR